MLDPIRRWWETLVMKKVIDTVVVIAAGALAALPGLTEEIIADWKSSTAAVILALIAYLRGRK